MRRTSFFFLSVGLLAVPVLGQPAEWSDDFQTVTTYGSASLLAPCYGGPATKYTVLEAVISDIFNERLYSGGGKLKIVNRDGLITNPILPGRVEVAIFGWVGLGLGCPGEPAVFASTNPFTSHNLCLYGAWCFDAWNLRVPETGFPWVNVGPDGEPGILGVDDDNDGTTDGTIGAVGFDDDGDGTIDEPTDLHEWDEMLAGRPSTVNGGFGSSDGTGFEAGQDAAPGVAGVDDDGNGTVDDIGETGWPGTDDGDDRTHSILWMMIRTDLSKSEAIYLDNDLGFGGSFAIRETRNLDDIGIESEDEIPNGFYQPDTVYNWVFCESGTCYGAQLWVEKNLGNPSETVGPVINTFHTAASANGVAFGFVKNTSANQYMRHLAIRGNSSFSDAFWVISGTPQNFYPSPSADLDNDRDVDANDFLTFSNCFNGSLNPPKGICASLNADLDGDSDVDANDFLTFSNCFNGALAKPKALCFPPDLTTCIAPGNDTCAGALPIGETTVVGLINSVVSHSQNHSCEADGRDLWYEYSPSISGTATIQVNCDTTGIAPNGGFNLAVYDGCGGIELVCSSVNNCNLGAGESITLPVVLGTPVYIAVLKESPDDIGQFRLEVSVVP